MKQSRWKSPVLWTALTAQVLVILKVTGVWNLIGIPESVVTDTVAALLQIGALVGVINNPTDAEAW